MSHFVLLKEDNFRLLHEKSIISNNDIIAPKIIHVMSLTISPIQTLHKMCQFSGQYTDTLLGTVGCYLRYDVLVTK